MTLKNTFEALISNVFPVSSQKGVFMVGSCETLNVRLEGQLEILLQVLPAQTKQPSTGSNATPFSSQTYPTYRHEELLQDPPEQVVPQWREAAPVTVICPSPPFTLDIFQTLLAGTVTKPSEEDNT